MIFPLGRILGRPVAPHRLSLQAVELAWRNGYAWGATEASLCWLALGLVVLALALALRTRRP